MSVLSWFSNQENQRLPVSEGDPLPVQVVGSVQGTGLTYVTDAIVIPGIGTGAGYAAGDAVGTRLEIPNATRGEARTGILHGAVLYDLDDEGIELDLVLFRESFTPTADNSPFAVSDADLLKCIGSITFNTFKDFGNNQMSTLSGIGLPFRTVGTSLYLQAVTRGTPNIAAANEYRISLCFLQD